MPEYILKPIIPSDWLVELSDQQLELLTGGNQPQINNSNFAQRTGNTTGTNTAGPRGNTSQTNTQLSDVNSGAQSLLSSDTLRFSPLGGANNPTTTSSIPVNNPLGMF
jgi:hypothetical protein